MTVTTDIVVSSLVAAVVCAILMIAAHCAFQNTYIRLKRVEAYAVGTAIIGGVLTVWALLHNLPVVVVAYWAIAGGGGVADIVAWWVRGRVNRWRASTIDEGFLRGQIAGLDAASADYGDNADDDTTG